MEFVPYLNFGGDCRDAFEFYHRVLGGELVAMITHDEVGISEFGEEWKPKIMHARLIVDGQVLMGSDSPPQMYKTPASFSVALQTNTAEDAEPLFVSLSEGGSITIPLAEQPWATRFGMFTDRYGIPWMINCEQS
jgi:PhnB protein